MPKDTRDWRLSLVADYKLKSSVRPIISECQRCGGSGMVGGHFKSLDDPSRCPECGGSGQIEDRSNIEPKPAFPPGFHEHMKKAFDQFFIDNP